MANSEPKDIEVKTTLSESQFKAWSIVREAKGVTQAGALRHLILMEICESQELVSQLNQALKRTE